MARIMTAIPEYLTPKEVADILRVHPDTVIRRFRDRPGVLNLGSDESRFKRRYSTLRIPREALEKFIIENQVR